MNTSLRHRELWYRRAAEMGNPAAVELPERWLARQNDGLDGK